MRSVLVPVAESTQVYGSERSLRVTSSSSTGCSMPARRGSPVSKMRKMPRLPCGIVTTMRSSRWRVPSSSSTMLAS